MKVVFIKQKNGNLKGTSGSLPEKVAKKYIEDGICKAVEPKSKEKAKP